MNEEYFGKFWGYKEKRTQNWETSIRKRYDEEMFLVLKWRNYFHLDRFRTKFKTLCIELALVSKKLKNERLLHYFFKKPLHYMTSWPPQVSRITTLLTHYHPYWLQLTPPSTLPTTTPWASGITTLSLTYYHTHGLQVLPPLALHTTTPIGFRHYHLQPYNPSKHMFLSMLYIG